MNAYQYELETIQAVFNGGLTPNACDVISGLEPEMFSNDFNSKVWGQIKKLYSAGDLIEPLTVYENIEGVDSAEAINIWIEQNKALTGSPANIKGYAKRVRQASFLRQSKILLSEALEAVNTCNNEQKLSLIHI